MEDLCRAHPGFQAACARRGFPAENVCVDPWCVGYFSPADGPERRLAKPLLYVRDHEEDNIYARPLEGLVVLVDMQHGKVVHFEDAEVVPVPPRDGLSANWVLPVAEERGGLKALHITQPDGPSFTIDDGNRVSWQGWRFRVGFSPREGAVLQTVTYADPLAAHAAGGAGDAGALVGFEGGAGGKSALVRPVAFRVSVAEMVVPYGDPNVPHYVKNAFDAGEDGLGRNAHSLRNDGGCDCLGDGVRYLDASLVGADGGVGETLKNAVCIHEEDGGVLWKHMDWRSGRTEVRRGRRLVVSFICTIANYEYGFYYHLGMDGTLDVEVKLTGVLSTGALKPEELLPIDGGAGAGAEAGAGAATAGVAGRKYGLTLSLGGLYAPIHQHFFVARIDAAVDGLRNTVVEVDTRRAPPDREANPFRNAFYAAETPLLSEAAAVRDCSVASARHWKIESAASGVRRNRVGSPTAYSLHPHSGVLPFAAPDAHFMSRAGFLQHHLWVTAFHPNERFPGGDYPNQLDHPDGLPLWTRRDKPLHGADLVLWYVFGVTHVPRLEDWPVMPVERTGFSLRPTNFFDRSPALDAPPACRIPGQTTTAAACLKSKL